MRERKPAQSGQVALIVLLIAAVMLTVGLSVASRSVSELKLSEEEEGAVVALNTVEGSIEEILATYDFESMVVGSTDTFNANPVGGKIARCEVTAESGLINILVRAGHSVEFNTDGAGGTNSLEITNWTNTPAFVVTEYTNPASPNQLYRTAYDTGNNGSNGFVDDNSPPITINLNSNSKFVRIKALYSDSSIAITPGAWATEVANYVVNCQASDSGGSSIAVGASLGGSSLPSVFDYVLFSGGSLE